MGSNGTDSGFIHLNPDTSLAFLPPPLAAQLEATRYLSIAALAVCIFFFTSSGGGVRFVNLMNGVIAGIHLGSAVFVWPGLSSAHSTCYQWPYSDIFPF